MNSLGLSCLPGDLGAVLNMALDTQSPFNLARIRNTQERWWYPLRVCACSIRRYCGRTRSSWNHSTLPRPPRAILPTEPKDERHQAEERGPRQQLILRHPVLPLTHSVVRDQTSVVSLWHHAPLSGSPLTFPSHHQRHLRGTPHDPYTSRLGFHALICYGRPN